MPLKPEDKLAEVMALYETQREQAELEKANFLIYGRAGAGKTQCWATAPGPILCHSFDPGGTRTVTSLIKQGKIPASKKIIIDTRFETEMSRKPTQEKASSKLNSKGPFAYKLWEQEFNELAGAGIFDKLGTYVIDSGTRWLDCMLNEITQQEGRKYAESQIQDYKKLKFFALDALTEVFSIPCNLIITGHLSSYQDQSDGKTRYSLSASGKLKEAIPANFDELYYLSGKEEAGKVKRELLTGMNGKHEAKTRIGAGGKFQLWEEPNLANLLKKAGLPYADKEM